MFVIFCGFFDFINQQIKKWEQIALRELDPERDIDGEINPEIPINDQTELLSFDPRYEFPKERLKLGMQSVLRAIFYLVLENWFYQF